MAFDFPNSPSEGQAFAPTGGPIYVYTGGVWKMQGSGQVVTAEARNRIVNPAMQVSQENGNTAGTVTQYYPVDQFWTYSNASGGALSSQRVQVVTPNGSTNRLRAWASTAKVTLLTGETVWIGSHIEGIRVADFRWGSASAKQVVLRFGFKAPAGTYNIAIKNGSIQDRTYMANITISAAQANVDTEQTFVIPGDTTGTWAIDTGSGLQLVIALGIGATYQGVAGWQAGHKLGITGNSNGLATVGNTFELFDVGLYLDPNATGTPPPWQMPDEAQELAACMRYYVQQYATVSSNIGAGINNVYFPVPMRVAPAVTNVVVGTFNTATIADEGAFSNKAAKIQMSGTSANSYIIARLNAYNSRM